MPVEYKRSWKVAYAHLIPDAIIVIVSLYFSLIVRVSFDEVPQHLADLHNYLPLIVAIRLVINWLFGVYEIMWRYISPRDAIVISRATLTSSVAVMAVSFILADWFGRLPRAVYIIDFMTVTLGLLGIRILRRIYLEKKKVFSQCESMGLRTIIFGAGTNGHTLSHRFQADSGAGIDLIGFVDDDPSKRSLRIGGRPVFGSGDDLENIFRDYNVEQLVIAIDNMPGDRMRSVLQKCFEKGVRVKMLGSLRPKEKNQSVELIRDISLSDLLNRSSKEIDLQALRQLVQGKVVLITGAGGSIGSEIARQVATLNPHRLLLLDHSEFNLYNVDKELRVNSAISTKVVPLLVDIKDAAALTHVIKNHLPQVVFHAAAYKHVHLVESNPYPAIANNVLGTSLLLKNCKEIGVETFVLISTDKAVNPVGIMGATKRVCELLTTIYALETGRRYCSVRFGNVLGSSGSLIPLLQEQIRAGGPVTITHQDMTRYFMLIPEAVALVLKSATIARPGDIKVLKMGEPVRILDIAKSLISLMGASEKEIPIVFTGLRPGEKLFEELYIRGDELRTEHPDILSLPNGDSHLQRHVHELKTVLNSIEKMVERAEANDPLAILDLRALAKTTSFKEAAVPPTSKENQAELLN
ncbi:MAG: hypothetical protein A4S09_02595 [Proteobacteria bacterium SG_bin7]|nr:MAG: hypothetical protein A4S09_02595 [Proteobacteria bacterium SG_bin7]